MKPYYYVYRVNDRGPRIKHATLEQAHAEAMRLAGQHQGESFEILMCLATVRTTTPQAFWMDGVIPPHICAMSRAMNGECFICGDIPANVRALAPASDGKEIES
jgi:hypothetical protein